MSHNKMLIDATHPEETRVVVLKDGRVEEFDYESAARKLLRGSIFLAKVTRVEPSLQAAFVDFGGNRHGFLAFNEVHPDYYQIPFADRQALIDEDLRSDDDDDAPDDSERRAERQPRSRRRGRPERGRGRRRDNRRNSEAKSDDSTATLPVDPVDMEATAVDVAHLLPAEPTITDSCANEAKPVVHSAAEAAARAAARVVDQADTSETAPPADAAVQVIAERFVSASVTVSEVVSEPAQSAVSAPSGEDNCYEPNVAEIHDAPRAIGLVEDEGVEDVNGASGDDDNGAEEEHIEVVGAEDVEEEMPTRTRRRMRSYKIQEVIKRRQVVLVQVVKEERGTKGAALTSYLSLAGRYTVLMPNTGRGGGISRKITSGVDRKRLKEIADELEVPEGMGLIIRTAGASRTKQEIKRDFEYLLRLWESVRELTLRSTAPCLVYEEGDLIKRSIRDLYSKDIDEIVVAGEAAHVEARDFMSMLMPSHARNVLRYESAEPLFSKYRIEQQLNAMFSPYVHLKSGGYLVINQTEALVSIDINSGKSTREFSIEETALATNLEAADEIARQLRLRDLAGLIVIDFIDMEEKRNNRAVERRVKDALRFDRARIQVGRISHFGLLEMSRQRLRTGVLEGSTSQCPHCQGTGIIRSTESVALAVLRGLEDALKGGNVGRLVASTTAAVALYLLNQKRQFIVEMERRSGTAIEIAASDKMHGASFTIDRQARATVGGRASAQSGVVNMETGFADDDLDDVEPTAASEPADDSEAEGNREDDGRSRRRRRRGRGRGGARGPHSELNGHAEASDNGADNNSHGDHDDQPNDEPSIETSGDSGDNGDVDDAPTQAGDGDGRSRRRRRGRRGGRRNREGGAGLSGVAAPDAPQPYFDDETPTEQHSAMAHEEISSSQPREETRATQHLNGASSTHPQEEPRAASPASTVDVEPVAQTSAEPTVARTDKAEPRAASIELVASRSETQSVQVEITEAAPVTPVETPQAQPPVDRPAAVSVPELPTRAARAQPVHSEPVLKRVVVGTSESTVEAAKSDDADTASAPTRKGWWQRRLGI